MTAHTLFIAMVLAAFGTFMVTLAGVHLYVLLDPRTRKRPAPRPVQAAAPARRDAAVHA